MAKTLEFNVEMTCEGCSGAITRILSKQKEKGDVLDFKVVLEDNKVFVTTSLSEAEVKQILEKSGKKTTFVGQK